MSGELYQLGAEKLFSIYSVCTAADCYRSLPDCVVTAKAAPIVLIIKRCPSRKQS